MTFTNTTEQDSKYNNLEEKDVKQLLDYINNEDKTVPLAVEKAIPQIEILIQQVIKKLQNGGRLFYIGAGTSGRLGIVDASECPPTFGVDPDLVVAIIAGGDFAIRKAVENAEDSSEDGWLDLVEKKVSEKDIVIGIAASGTTPYVIGALEKCNQNGIITGCITCNEGSPLVKVSKFPVVVVVGPEFITGSSRMKAGTAQKLVLNMITTTTMVKLGRVKGNKMIDMKLSNNKLVDRGIKIIIEELNISYTKAVELLSVHQNVRKAIKAYHEHEKNK